MLLPTLTIDGEQITPELRGGVKNDVKKNTEQSTTRGFEKEETGKRLGGLERVFGIAGLAAHAKRSSVGVLRSCSGGMLRIIQAG